MTAATPATQTTWAIDAKHTSLEFAVKHMIFATAKGRFGEFAGTIVLDEANPAQSSVNVEIQAASIDTREGQRDGHLKSPDFFDVANHPVITFASTRVEPISDNRLRVVGNLTIRDITREVVLDTTYHGNAQNPWGGQVAAFSAEATIVRQDYNLVWNVPLEKGGFLVGDTVKISLEIEAIKQG